MLRARAAALSARLGMGFPRYRCPREGARVSHESLEPSVLPNGSSCRGERPGKAMAQAIPLAEYESVSMIANLVLSAFVSPQHNGYPSNAVGGISIPEWQHKRQIITTLALQLAAKQTMQRERVWKSKTYVGLTVFSMENNKLPQQGPERAIFIFQFT